MLEGCCRKVAGVGLTGLVAATMVAVATGQAPATGEWRSYAGDLTSSRYSSLDQINATNFDKLQVALRFKTDNLGPRPEFQYEGTPLMVNGVMYATGGSRRAVVFLRSC